MRLYWILFFIPFYTFSAQKGLFDEKQKNEAKAFISDCFNGVAQELSQELHYAKACGDAKEVERIRLYYQGVYETEQQLSRWGMTHEADAQALCSFLKMTEEWRLYKADPRNVKRYAYLHKQMTKMAGILIDGRTSGHYGLVQGTQQYLQLVDKPSYDLDKICLLTLFLLQQELDEKPHGLKRKRAYDDESDEPPSKKKHC